ncbi:SIR2 family protein, partial [Salmonella enterica]
MQFITNGPDIPDSLLQAHEDGKVVFFCGAGISYPAGLPGFGDLVDKIYQKIGEKRNALEEAAYKAYQYDTTLELLERRIVGNKQTVRQALAQILKPKIRRENALTTHNALLQLSQDQAGRIRLVTTNFDHLFDIAAKNMKKKLTSYLAPMLPVPKNSRWNGVVYLHGILPHDKKNHTELNRLVVTSGDFGCAYLTERWAARFVSELFRNYVVCFIGYSINDPVLRYMMDALA